MSPSAGRGEPRSCRQEEDEETQEQDPGPEEEDRGHAAGLQGQEAQDPITQKPSRAALTMLGKLASALLTDASTRGPSIPAVSLPIVQRRTGFWGLVRFLGPQREQKKLIQPLGLKRDPPEELWVKTGTYMDDICLYNRAFPAGDGNIFKRSLNVLYTFVMAGTLFLWLCILC